MWYKRLLLSLTCVLLICIVHLNPIFVPAARAQEDAPSPEQSTCRTCHEDRYYLFDSGKWQCMCSKQRSCEGCHSGDPTTFDKDLAHAGMAADPITENPKVCQDCHPADYEARIDKFLLLSGGARTEPNGPTSLSYAPLKASSGSSESIHPLLTPEPMEPRRAAALGFLVVPMGGLLVFGFRCYKTDCAKRHL